MREERGGFLRKLGALRRRPGGEEADTPPTRTDPRGQPPHDFGQGEPVRYRLRLDRLGPAVLAGHLDWVRALPRILRRAGLRTYYSEGFHPKPKLEFPPALPLGAASLDEAVDVGLAEEVAPEEVLRRLREAAPAGVAFHEVTLLPPGASRLNRSFTAVEWLVRLEGALLERAGLDAAALDAAPARLLAHDSIPWTTERKRQRKDVDLRPAILEARWVAPEEIPERLGFLREGARYLRLRIRNDLPGLHARPEEVAAAMLGGDPGIEAVHLARIGLVR
jgi:radical SAM-linked protein